MMKQLIEFRALIANAIKKKTYLCKAATPPLKFCDGKFFLNKTSTARNKLIPYNKNEKA